jgi:hypothetical protein
MTSSGSTSIDIAWPLTCLRRIESAAVARYRPTNDVHRLCLVGLFRRFFLINETSGMLLSLRLVLAGEEAQDAMHKPTCLVRKIFLCPVLQTSSHPRIPMCVGSFAGRGPHFHFAYNFLYSDFRSVLRTIRTPLSDLSMSISYLPKGDLPHPRPCSLMP